MYDVAVGVHLDCGVGVGSCGGTGGHWSRRREEDRPPVITLDSVLGLPLARDVGAGTPLTQSVFRTPND